MDKRMIGLFVVALGLMLASLAVYFFGVSSENESKSDSIGSKIACALACLLLLGGGSMTFLGFKDRSVNTWQ